MLLLPLLALAAAWSHGQVLLKQSQVSTTKRQTKTAWIECKAEGISDFRSAYIHWYRHIPPKAPERILYIGSAQPAYDDSSYRNKFGSSKKDTDVCTLTVRDVDSSDEGLTHTGNMLLLPVLLASSLWSRGDTQAVPVQSPALRRQVKGSSVSMECRMSADNTVHWYKQLPGQPPERILYMSGQSPVFDDSGDKRRFQARKHSTKPLYSLRIGYLTPSDSGNYYCAYWFFQGITALDGQRLAIQKGRFAL
ncbi:uncharacterized protein LOC142052886 [Phalacrocorax aristotelis]|uniref:uncharacterized protein LOC142052881 n=1 Tax=Phalacrocorax aristotelis TaxID=126867 RepID=UPI003F4B6149